MSLCLIGTKLGMTQLFAENGDTIPVTVVEVGPCPVVQVKTEETDGYNAIQVGFGDKKEKNVTKPLQGHYGKAGVASRRYLKEARIDNVADYTVGQELTAAVFEEGDFVDVIGKTRGKGFAGAVKRHGFGGGRKSHGGRGLRRVGSIGMAATPARVLKGKKMPGQMGNRQCTVQNLEVVAVRADQNQILIKGAIPGSPDSVVYIRKAKKKSKQQ